MARRVRDVIYNVVRPRGVATDSVRKIVQDEQIAGPPGDVVIGAGRIATDSNGADELLRGIIKCKSATEHVNAADTPAHHGVVGLTIVCGIPAISNISIDRITVLQPKEAASRLHGVVKIRRGKH